MESMTEGWWALVGSHLADSNKNDERLPALGSDGLASRDQHRTQLGLSEYLNWAQRSDDDWEVKQGVNDRYPGYELKAPLSVDLNCWSPAGASSRRKNLKAEIDGCLVNQQQEVDLIYPQPYPILQSPAEEAMFLFEWEPEPLANVSFHHQTQPEPPLHKGAPNIHPPSRPQTPFALPKGGVAPTVVKRPSTAISEVQTQSGELINFRHGLGHDEVLRWSSAVHTDGSPLTAGLLSNLSPSTPESRPPVATFPIEERRSDVSALRGRGSENTAIVRPASPNIDVLALNASMKFGTPLSVRYHAYKRSQHASTPLPKGDNSNPTNRFTHFQVSPQYGHVNTKPRIEEVSLPKPGATHHPVRPTLVSSRPKGPPLKQLRTPLVSNNKVSILERIRNLLHTLDNLKASKRSDFSTMRSFVALFREITSTKAHYRSVLSYQGRDAQLILDSLQMLLDHPLPTDSVDKRNFLRALLRISKRTGLYPQCLVLKEVTHEDYAVAAGHFSEVYKGSFRGRSVALKVIRIYQQSDTSKVLQVFAKEGILWSQLGHRNLLPFYGIFHLNQEDRRICFVSPWMKHGNITNYLAKKPEVNRLLLLLDIITGIAYLHSINIVHSDLKGDNVLVAPSGRACLADFGLSNLIDSEILSWTSIRSTAQHGGTTRWQAPELFDPDTESIAANKETDIYSFACICYEILTGKIPFHEYPRDPTVMMKVMAGQRPSKPPPPSPAYMRWGLTEDLWDLMQECWQREPEQRPKAEGVAGRTCFGELVDDRPNNHWEGFSAAEFRSAMYDFAP